jgi:hypothetical protein
VKLLIWSTLILLGLGTQVLAANTGLQTEERIFFPQEREIYVRPVEGGLQEVGFISGGKRFILFRTKKIVAAPEFNDSSVKTGTLPWHTLHQNEAATSWFYFVTAEGLQIIRKTPESVGSEFISVLIPVKAQAFTRFSTHMVIVPPEKKDVGIFVSFENQLREKSTFVVMTVSSEEKGRMGTSRILKLSEEYIAFDRLKSVPDGVTIQSDSIVLLGKSFSIKTLMATRESLVAKGKFTENIKSTGPVANARDLGGYSFTGKLVGGAANAIAKASGIVDSLADNVARMRQPDMPPVFTSSRDSSHTPPADQKEITYTPEPLPIIQSTDHAPAAAPSAAPVVPASTGNHGETRELEYNGEKFTVYNVKSGKEEGVYIRRTSDKKTAVIALQMVPLGAEGDESGFSIKEGILEHPALGRQIDLEKAAFEIETTFRPRATGLEKVQWADAEFPNIRTQETVTLSAIAARKPLVDSVLQQIVQSNRPGTMLMGEAGDKDVIIQEVIKQLPRTWRILDLDPSVIGSEIGISGKFEEKVRDIVAAQKTTPIVWIGKDFENMKGLGATGDSKRDFLDLMSREMGNAASFRVIGTSFQSTDFLDKVQSASILQNLSLKEVEDLTPKQVFEYLHSWLQTRADLPPVSADFIQRLLEVSQFYRPVDPEPQRSQSLLENHILRMINSGHTARLMDRTELEKSAAEYYRLDPVLRNRKLLKARLDNYKNFMSQRIIGNEHFIDAAFMSTFTAWGGMSSQAGPKSSFFLDGPPGVGKTELAKAHAEAMGLPFLLIEMNQFERSSGNGINELLSQISKAMKVNPFTVICLDEVEKADPAVLKGLLSLMYNKTFSFYENQGAGQKRAVRSSAVNATVFFTANTVGEEVRDFFNEIPPAERENLTSKDLNKKFHEIVSAQQIEDTQVERGLPRPLMDRIKVRTLIFPLNAKGLEKMFTFKIRSLKAQAELEFRSTVEFIGVRKFVQESVQTAMQLNQSTRTLIEVVESKLRYLSSHINFLENYSEKSSYVVDVAADEAYAGGIVKIFKRDPRRSCNRALVH